MWALPGWFWGWPVWFVKLATKRGSCMLYPLVLFLFCFHQGFTEQSLFYHTHMLLLKNKIHWRHHLKNIYIFNLRWCTYFLIVFFLSWLCESYFLFNCAFLPSGPDVCKPTVGHIVLKVTSSIAFSQHNCFVTMSAISNMHLVYSQIFLCWSLEMLVCNIFYHLLWTNWMLWKEQLLSNSCRKMQDV